jgi:hypothetical protein
MTRLLLVLLAFYKRWLSPAFHALGSGGCKYVPTCSEYAAEAINLHGPLRGCGLALWRLLRCHPFMRGGLDPVPVPQGRQGCFTGVPAVRSEEPGPGARPFPHKPLP